MKKSLLALLCATLFATLPLTASAANYNLSESCPDGELIVASGETVNINLDGNSVCHITNNGTAIISGTGSVDSKTAVPTITNNGTLTINSGNINKTAKHDSVAPIVNNGTLVINGGNILADHGIQHNRGTLTMNGGKIRAWLHPAIWANNSASVRINGGTLQFPRDWVGIHTAGNVAICGGNFIGGSRTNLSAEEETKTCPAKDSTLTTPEKTPAKPIANLVKVENDAAMKAAKAEQAKVAQVAKPETPAVKATATIVKKTTPIIITAQPRTTDHIAKQGSTKNVAPKADASTKTTETANQEPEKKAEEQNADLSVAIAAILLVIVSASTGIIVTRNK